MGDLTWSGRHRRTFISRIATLSLGSVAALGGVRLFAGDKQDNFAQDVDFGGLQGSAGNLPAPLPLETVPDTLPPLETITFAAASVVIPMDDKQNDRTAVFGFIHALLRNGAELLRIIEPPVVTLVTALNPSGAVYDGGVILVDSRFSSIVYDVEKNPDFANVTRTILATSFTSNAVFRVRIPTKILVIRGIWGRTELTLAQMKFPQHDPAQGPFDSVRDAFDVIEPEKIEADPSIIDNYTLIVVDCPGWFGNPPGANTPEKQERINAVYAKIKARAEKGNEVIFTDIAIRDMDRIWPGKLNLDTIVGSQSIPATFHNPPIGKSFLPEFPSQYWNTPPDPNSIRILAPGSGTFVTSVTDASKPEVRVVIDTFQMNKQENKPGVYGMLGFYFEVGNGIAEGLVFHPQEQIAPYADEKGHFANFQIYGNKFVHGIPTPSYALVCPVSMPAITIQQTKTVNVTVSIRSFNAFSAPVTLSLTLLASGVTGTFNPPAPVPPPNGIATSVLTLTAAANAQTGIYTVRVTGVNNDNPAFPLFSSCDFTLEVQVMPLDFSVAATPNLIVVQAGKTGNSSIAVYSQGIFNSPVSLRATNLPPNMSGSFAPAQVTPPAGGGANSVLTINTQSDSVPGDYQLSIVGTSIGPQLQNQQRTASLTLRITPPPVTVTQPTTVIQSTTVTEPKSTQPSVITSTIDPALVQGIVGALVGSILLFAALFTRRLLRRGPALKQSLPAKTCQTCGFQNPPYVRSFCVRCGTSLNE